MLSALDKHSRRRTYSYHLIFRELVLTKSYTTPPTLDITLEEFETFAINRLRILSYIESLQHRSLPYAQFQTQLSAYLKQYLPLSSNTARSVDLVAERRGDEIGHWVLRLAFCRSYVFVFLYLRFSFFFLISWCSGLPLGLRPTQRADETKRSGQAEEVIQQKSSGKK